MHKENLYTTVMHNAKIEIIMYN